MNKLDQMLQEIVNLSYDEIRDRAMILAKECADGFDALKIPDVSGILFVEKFLANTIAIDGKYSASEQKLINEMFKVPGRVEQIANQTSVEDLKNFDTIIDALPSDLKSSFCLLAIYVLAVDEHIDSTEYKYLLMLLA